MGGIVDAVFGGGDDGSAASDAAANIANSMWNSTGKIRNPLIDMMAEVTGGNFDPASSPLFSGVKSNVDDQFKTAENNVLSMIPEGGVLQDALAGLETGKAKTLSEMMGSLENDWMNKAYGAAFQAPGEAMSGLTSAGALDSQNYATNQGLLGDLGSGLGLAWALK